MQRAVLNSSGCFVLHCALFRKEIRPRPLRLCVNRYRYVDDSNTPTEAYPFNPNGSPDGIAALCSEDGRHLAMMPHPERCFLTWQVRLSMVPTRVIQFVNILLFIQTRAWDLLKILNE